MGLSISQIKALIHNEVNSKIVKLTKENKVLNSDLNKAKKELETIKLDTDTLKNDVDTAKNDITQIKESIKKEE